MKIKLVLFFLALPCLMMAQGGQFSIQGKIDAKPAAYPKKVYLVYVIHSGDNGRTTIKDSTDVSKKGEYKFAGQVPGFTIAYVAFDHTGAGVDSKKGVDDFINVILPGMGIGITSSDRVDAGKVSGSPQTDQMIEYRALEAKFDGQVKGLNKEYNDASPEQKESEDFIGGLQARMGVMVQDRQVDLKQFISKYPGSYLSLDAVKTVMSGKWKPDEVEPLLKSLTPELQNSAAGKALADKIDIARKTSAGSPAFEFTMNTADGKPVKLSDYRGKYVLIDFWASWCGPCRGENPNVVKAYAAYHGKGFEILGISLDDNKDKWLAAIEKDNLTWTHVSDLQGWNNSAAKLYGVQSIPANFLIDPQGNIVATNLRGEALTAKLAEIYGN